MERGAIATVARAKRNKPMYAVNEEGLWRWASEVVESQKPRAAVVDSLTATLYYTNGRQAKADRTTLAIQQRCIRAGEPLELGNWHELVLLVDEMDKESSELLKCDFDLVLKDVEVPQLVAQSASQVTARGVGSRRTGVVTAIMEEGLASVVTDERCATGSAIGIRDYWRCSDDGCPNKPIVCWIRRIPRRQIDRPEEHFPVNGNIISQWARAIARGECTIEEPSEQIKFAVISAKDRSDHEKSRRRRKVSPASSNSSIESLTKAILVSHLAQLKAPPQQCNHQLFERTEYSQRHRRQ